MTWTPEEGLDREDATRGPDLEGTARKPEEECEEQIIRESEA